MLEVKAILRKKIEGLLDKQLRPKLNRKDEEIIIRIKPLMDLYDKAYQINSWQ